MSLNRTRRSMQGIPRARSLVPRNGRQQLPQVYLGPTTSRTGGIYGHDLHGVRHGSKLKWLISTCLAAGVGVIAIGIVVYASMDDKGGGVLTALERAGRAAMVERRMPTLNAAGAVTTTKSDRLVASADGLTTRLIIHDMMRQQKGASAFIVRKPYQRIVATLPTVPLEGAEQIPPFNPFSLYAPAKSRAGAAEGDADRMAIKVLDLPDGMLPDEDGQSLGEEEVSDIVAHSLEESLEGNASSHFRPLWDSLAVWGQLLAFTASSLVGFAVDVAPPAR